MVSVEIVEPARPAALAPRSPATAEVGDAGATPAPRIAEILRVVERLLTEQQELVLRREALAGRVDEAAVRERAALDSHMGAHHVSLDRLFAELGMLVPPDGRPPGGA